MTSASLTALRPMDLSDLLDTAFALYRRNFALFAGVVAVLTVPQTLLAMIIQESVPQSPFTTTQNEPPDQVAHRFLNNIGPYAAGLSAITLLSFLFGVLITGALAYAISARYLDEDLTVEDAYYGVGAGRFVILLLATILGPLAAILAILVAAGVIAGVTVLLSQLVGGLAALFAVLAGSGLFVAAIWAFVHFVFVSQVVVLERAGLVASFKRSWALVDGSWWRVFGIGLVLLIMVAIIEGILTGLGTGVFTVMGVSGLPQRLLNQAVSGVTNIVVQPIQLGTVTLLYYDLRIRKEGFDLERLARTLQTEPPT